MQRYNKTIDLLHCTTLFFLLIHGGFYCGVNYFFFTAGFSLVIAVISLLVLVAVLGRLDTATKTINRLQSEKDELQNKVESLLRVVGEKYPLELREALLATQNAKSQ